MFKYKYLLFCFLLLQYENQVTLPIVGWTNKGPLNRPKWSDSQGKVKSPKEKFDPPPGWRWDSEWYVSPELR